NQPISKASGLVPLLVAMGLVEERANFLYYDGEKLGRSYKTTERFLPQDDVGKQILDQYPDLLESADAAITAGRAKRVTLLEGTQLTGATDGNEEESAGE